MIYFFGIKNAPLNSITIKIKGIKMKKILLSILMLLSTSSHATLIDFDDLSFNTRVSNQYMPLGVLFSAYENDIAVNAPIVHDNWQNSSDVLGRDDMGLSNCYDTQASCNRADVMRIDFIDTASNISWLQNNEGSDDPFWQLFDDTDTLIETINVNGPSSWFNVAAASSNVSYMLGFQPRDNWTWSIDNLQFTIDETAVVPEPSTLAIFALSIIGLASRRFKKQS